MQRITAFNVQELITIPFHRQSEANKMRIILEGKPRPPLKMSAVAFTENDGMVNYEFKPSMYDKVQWLTGCERTGRLFCWPCLLFEPPEMWNIVGVSDIVHLIEGASEHEQSAAHKDAVMKLERFTERAKSSANEEEQSNFEILKPKLNCENNNLDRVAQELQGESTTSLNKENSIVIRMHPNSSFKVIKPSLHSAYIAFLSNNNKAKCKDIKKQAQELQWESTSLTRENQIGIQLSDVQPSLHLRPLSPVTLEANNNNTKCNDIKKQAQELQWESTSLTRENQIGIQPSDVVQPSLHLRPLRPKQAQGLQWESTSLTKENQIGIQPNDVVQPSLHLRPLSLATLESYAKCKNIKKRLIDVCCLALELNHFSGCYSSESLFQVEKCIKIMQFLKNYDTYDKYLSVDAINLMKDSPKVVESMFGALVKAVTLAISKEVFSSNYVSLILNQHSDDEAKPKISFILRYVKDGKVCEHFLGFSNMTAKLSANILYKQIKDLLKEYRIEYKISTISLDGAMLHIDELKIFLDKIKCFLPHCFFLPWHSHSVNYILQQSLSSIPPCRLFFKTMAGIQEFFQENYEILIHFIHRNHPDFIFIYNDYNLSIHNTNNKFASSQFITTVKKNRQAIVDFLDSAIKSCPKLCADSIVKAFAFKKWLKRLKTVFLLEVFSRLFDLTKNLNAALKDDKFKFSQNIIVALLTADITTLHTTKFNELWCCIEKEMTSETSQREKFCEKKQKYITLFSSITKLVIQEIHIRYDPLTKLTFCDRFNTKKNEDLKQFKLWAKSLKPFSNHFNKVKTFINLLTLLHNQNIFSQKSVIDFYQLLENSNLHHKFKYLSRLSEFISAMPFISVSHFSNVSRLWSVTKSNNHNSSIDVSILHVEFDILQTVKQSASFYDEVISVYKEL